MILISHRGNIAGKQLELENKPEYVMDAILKGYNVEIDVWWHNKNFYLGHDSPLYKIDTDFLYKPVMGGPQFWCHAKNWEAIIEIKKLTPINRQVYPFPNIHYFWHQKDDLTLTSQGYIWAYPGKQPIKDSIAVMPELYQDNLDICKGVCSDNIENYKK